MKTSTGKHSPVKHSTGKQKTLDSKTPRARAVHTSTGEAAAIAHVTQAVRREASGRTPAASPETS